jgi:hypothetical protein
MNNFELEKQINAVISHLVDQKGYICSIDILIRLGYLSQTDYENWRNGKIEYLEKACRVNLGKLTTINRIIRQISRRMQLAPSLTVYNKFGKGPKTRLRFSKSGEENIEKSYATHYVNKFRINQLKELKTNRIPDENNRIS